MPITLQHSYLYLRTLASRTYVVFAAVAVLFGLAFICSIPPLWGLDETSHIERAYTISTGHVLASKSGDGYGGKVPQNLVALADYSHRDISNNKHASHFYARGDVDSRKAYDELASKPLRSRMIDQSFTGAAAYSPLAYTGQVGGVTLARLTGSSVGTMVVLARLGGLLAYVAVVAWALRLLQDHHFKWVVFTIALLPVSVFQSAVVTTDSLSLAFALLLFAAVVTRARRTALTAAVLALALMKPNYFLLTPMLLFAPGIRKAYKVGLFGAGCVLLGLWLVASAPVASAIATISFGAHSGQMVDTHAQLAGILQQPAELLATLVRTLLLDDSAWFLQIFGLLGGNALALPSFLMQLSFAGLLLAALYGAVHYSSAHGLGKRLAGWSYLLISTGVFFSIILTLYLTFTVVHGKFAQGVQGRYFIPLLPFTFYGLRLLVPLELRMPARTAAMIFITVPCAVLLGALYIYYRGTYV